MDEYIKKQPLRQFILNGLNSGTLGYDACKILAEIDYTEAADVKPVVRCKDCKWATNIITGEVACCAYLGDLFQSFNKKYIKPDFYCAAGERRE